VARGRDSGIEAVQRLAFVWTLRNGKGLGLQTFASKAEALEAAGLPATQD
jgi:hypothetical protein